MKLLSGSPFLAGAFATAVFASSFVAAQLSVEQVTATNKLLQQIKAGINKLPPSHQQMLDGYANIGHLADVWQTYGMRLADPTFVARARMANVAASTPGAGLIRVSDPSTDVAYSSFGGFTQSETSTARCGNSVVVGYNDSGSVFETPLFFTGSGGESFSGASYSTNGGASFTDIGPINPGPNNFNFLGGDPVLNCADSNTFYFSQIFDYDDASGNPWAAIAINVSTDGGKTWGDPIAAVSKSALAHFLDKPWSTIDPSDHKHIFVSYTDFDSSETNSCGANFPNRTAIEFVESRDGGVTWSHADRCHLRLRHSRRTGISNGGQLQGRPVHLLGQPGQQLPARSAQHSNRELRHQPRDAHPSRHGRRIGAARRRFVLPSRRIPRLPGYGDGHRPFRNGQ